ncbi:MAG: carbon storage regulator [Bryobacteraceae bacterium]|jgi:carbon storage regulator
MLVIRRKIGQSVRIGEDILVEVLEATPSRVKIGVTAPPHVRVVRSEVILAENQNREAASGARPELLASLARQMRGQAAPSSLNPAPAGSGGTSTP